MSKIKLSLLSLVASTSLFGANNIEIQNIGVIVIFLLKSSIFLIIKFVQLKNNITFTLQNIT
jgi:energy-converting hydrogenase Eha subunit E